MIKSKKENDKWPDMINTLFYQYWVERIDYHQTHLVAGLFNQCNGDQLFNRESVIFIALANYPDSIPVGFVQLDLNHSSIKGVKCTVIKGLFVLPNHRKRGIALKLIEEAVKFSIQNRSARIQYETLDANNPMVEKLYESVGFKRHNQRSGWDLYFIDLNPDSGEERQLILSHSA
jgi:GNAT superfamily N-acetyltransferase